MPEEQVNYAFFMHHAKVDNLFSLVRVWDTVGEDQVLKGEYKVISGRMYVQPGLFASCHV